MSAAPIPEGAADRAERVLTEHERRFTSAPDIAARGTLLALSNAGLRVVDAAEHEALLENDRFVPFLAEVTAAAEGLDMDEVRTIDGITLSRADWIKHLTWVTSASVRDVVALAAEHEGLRELVRLLVGGDVDGVPFASWEDETETFWVYEWHESTRTYRGQTMGDYRPDLAALLAAVVDGPPAALGGEGEGEKP